MTYMKEYFILVVDLSLIQIGFRQIKVTRASKGFDGGREAGEASRMVMR